MRIRIATGMVGLLLLSICGARAEDATKPRVKLTTNRGVIVVELEPAKAPVTVQNFLAYVRDGYYDGTVFHRVIPGFMIQGGGLDENLQEKVEGQRPPIKNESDNGLKNEAGTIAMARTSVPDSATSQFFINVKDNGFLDRAQAQDKVGYAVFGRVVDGMDVVHQIEGVKTTTRGIHRDVPVEPVTITDAQVLEGASAAAPGGVVAPTTESKAGAPGAAASKAAPKSGASGTTN
jgi:cyclophilin family peptidyl-prolyl cis-trans isomerase